MQVEQDIAIRGYPHRENYLQWERAVKDMIIWWDYFISIWDDEIANQFERDGVVTVTEWLFRIEDALNEFGQRGALPPETVLARDFNTLVDVIADFTGPTGLGGHVDVTPSPTAPVLRTICELTDVNNDNQSNVDIFTEDRDIFPFEEETWCLHLPDDGCIGKADTVP